MRDEEGLSRPVARAPVRLRFLRLDLIVLARNNVSSPSGNLNEARLPYRYELPWIE
jgi:hypothetical protein